jgi:UDP-GlcNAc:undecaprenyl-phosphate/decaprenyl-phosphate GlcNAc-1-phosphate transferase
MIDLENFSLPVIFLVFISGMLLVSVAITGLLLKFSTNLGAKNEGEQIRWAATTKPAFGGVSFFIIFLLSIVFYAIFFGNSQLLLNAKFLGLLVGSSMGFMMGLADDAYNTKPFLKFVVQFAVAIIFIATGNVITTFQYEWLNITLTILWVVGMMNSVNMLDNMDAITASISTIICAAAAMVLVFAERFGDLDMILMLGTMSGIGGFLYYNWNPSRMYMGDSGSQFLGAFLAAISMTYFWNAPDYYGQLIPSKQVLIVALIFIVPLADTASVSINRILKGKSPFVGGRDHTTHHLSYMGLSDRHVAMLMIVISLTTMALSVLIINNIENWTIIHTIGFGVLFLLISGSLYSTTRISKPGNKK